MTFSIKPSVSSIICFTNINIVREIVLSYTLLKLWHSLPDSALKEGSAALHHPDIRVNGLEPGRAEDNQ